MGPAVKALVITPLTVTEGVQTTDVVQVQVYRVGGTQACVVLPGLTVAECSHCGHPPPMDVLRRARVEVSRWPRAASDPGAWEAVNIGWRWDR